MRALFNFSVPIGLALAVSGGHVLASDGAERRPELASYAPLDVSVDIPQGVRLQELFRYVWRPYNTPPYHFSATYNPFTSEGRYKLEGTIGFISSEAFEGSQPIFSCMRYHSQADWSSFTSADPGCEGRILNPYYGFIGHVASTQLAGTVPLYRCRYTSREVHFDTLSPNCEGQTRVVLEGVLGFIFL